MKIKIITKEKKWSNTDDTQDIITINIDGQEHPIANEYNKDDSGWNNNNNEKEKITAKIVFEGNEDEAIDWILKNWGEKPNNDWDNAGRWGARAIAIMQDCYCN